MIRKTLAYRVLAVTLCISLSGLTLSGCGCGRDEEDYSEYEDYDGENSGGRRLEYGRSRRGLFSFRRFFG